MQTKTQIAHALSWQIIVKQNAITELQHELANGKGYGAYINQIEIIKNIINYKTQEINELQTAIHYLNRGNWWQRITRWVLGRTQPANPQPVQP